jgi:hypothetical protein
MGEQKACQRRPSQHCQKITNPQIQDWHKNILLSSILHYTYRTKEVVRCGIYSVIRFVLFLERAMTKLIGCRVADARALVYGITLRRFNRNMTFFLILLPTATFLI